MKVLFLWNRCADYIQKYQSGADIVDYFNTKLSEVQYELFNDLSPLYDKNEMVKELLNFWVRQQAGSSMVDGSQSLGNDPEIVNRPLAIGYTDGTSILFSITEASESELVAAARMPQRAPSVNKKIVYYRFNAPGTLNFYPAAITPYFCYYLVYPTEAKIAFTYSSTDDEDIMTYDDVDSIDLAWPEAADNLIIYKMLEKIGVSIREELLQAYAKYGITQLAQVEAVSK